MGNVSNPPTVSKYQLTDSSDFAEAYPNTATIGTDLSPIQPNTRPPNLSFEIDDCCSDWVYPKDHFDYIHIRLLYGSVADWPKFYKDCYEYAYARAPSVYEMRSLLIMLTAIWLLAVISNK